MKIDWTIAKRRGNHRPVLKYTIELEDFETALAVPQVVLEDALVRPPSSWRSYCYPGADERFGPCSEHYRLMTPSHGQRVLSDSLTLGWRPPADAFDDVRRAFKRLRDDFEGALRNAYESAPLDIVEHLELTRETREHIARGVAAAKFLAVAGF
ncbi:hypothetical protein [Pseudodesulfovibrio sp.]|uniref:hypothetical protein n=1 Tax=unclassified Pseudodesulfovibrio TaxID=2661612 RepID=UPI003B009BAA